MSVLPLYKESMHKGSALPESAPGTPADYYCHLLNPGGGWGKGHSIISPHFWSDKTNSSIKVAV